MIKEDGIRAAQLLDRNHFKNLDDTEAEVVSTIRSIFGIMRSELLSVNGRSRNIDWKSIEIFSRKDEAVLGYPKIGIGISFDFSKIEIKR